MPTPEDAQRVPSDIDPHEIVEVIANGAPLMQDGEAISDYTIVWTAEALAAADVSMRTGDYAEELVSINGVAARGVRFWPEFADPDDEAFDGDGVGFPFEFTFDTNSEPARRRQRTGIMWVRNQ